MKREILVGLVMVMVVIGGVVSQDAYARDLGEDDNWLTEEEQKYVDEVTAAESAVRTHMNTLRNYMARPAVFDDAWVMRVFDATNALRLASEEVSIITVPGSFNEVGQQYRDTYGQIAAESKEIMFYMDAGGIWGENANFEHAFKALNETQKWLNGSTEKLDNVQTELVVKAVDVEQEREEAAELVDEALDCFIATAAYGTPAAEEIDILRQWRDEFLLHNPPGIAFVAIYYEFSPPIADFISEHDVLRTAVREGFVDPVVSVVALTQGWWGE